MVNHWSSVDESGHHWLFLLLRCSQIHSFNRVSSNLFLSDGLLNFFNSFFHNCLDNLLLNCLLHRLLYSGNLCRLSNFDVVVNANRQLATEDGGVRSVDSMVDNRGSMVDSGVVNHRSSVVDDGRAAVDCVVYKGGMLDRSVMDSVNGSMCVVDWHVRPVHAVCCLGMEGGEAGVRPGSGQRQQQQRDGLHDVCRWYAGLCGSDTWFPLPIIIYEQLPAYVRPHRSPRSW